MVCNLYIHKKKRAIAALHFNYFCLQTWLPTVQLVLQADWQEVWHSPQPPVLAVFCKDFSCCIVRNTFSHDYPPQYLLYYCLFYHRYSNYVI